MCCSTLAFEAIVKLDATLQRLDNAWTFLIPICTEELLMNSIGAENEKSTRTS